MHEARSSDAQLLRWPLKLVIALFVCIGLTGCAESAASNTEDSAPLLAELGYGNSETVAEIRELGLRQLDDAVGECMVQQGFDSYPPGFVIEMLSPDNIGRESYPFEDAAGRDARDESFVRDYGYGYSAAILYRIGLIEESAGQIPTIDTSLQDALRSDLGADGWNSFMGAMAEDGSQAGCMEQARGKVDWARNQDALVEVLGSSQDEIAEAIEVDGRIRDIEKNWLECVRSKGYEASGPSDLRRNIEEAVNQTANTLEDRDALGAALMDLMSDETQVASVDLIECGGGPNAQQEFDEVLSELETKVIEANAERFD